MVEFRRASTMINLPKTSPVSQQSHDWLMTERLATGNIQGQLFRGGKRKKRWLLPPVSASNGLMGITDSLDISDVFPLLKVMRELERISFFFFFAFPNVSGCWSDLAWLNDTEWKLFTFYSNMGFMAPSDALAHSPQKANLGYMCDICKEGFKSAKGLSCHRASIHAEGASLFACKVCSKKFNTPGMDR